MGIIKDESVVNSTDNFNENERKNIWEQQYVKPKWDNLVKEGSNNDMNKYSGGYSPFVPDRNKNIWEQAYIASMDKPEAIDEKKIKDAKTVSAITDSLGLLAQMWSAGKGAHIRDRSNVESAQDKVNKREKELRDIYMKRHEMYNNGLYHARSNDLEYSTRLDNMTRAEQAEENKYRRSRQDKIEDDERNQTRAQAWAMNPLNPQNAHFEKQLAANEKHFAATERHRKAELAHSAARLSIEKERATQKIDATKKDYTPLAAIALLDKDFMSSLSDDFYEMDNNGERRKIQSLNVLGAAYESYKQGEKSAAVQSGANTPNVNNSPPAKKGFSFSN